MVNGKGDDGLLWDRENSLWIVKHENGPLY